MAQLLGPDDRQVKTTARGVTTFYPNRSITVYLDEALTQLASINAFNVDTPSSPGAAVAGSQLRLDEDSMCPRFWFPDGVDTVYGHITRGPAVPLRASTDFRLDLLEVGGGSGAGAGMVEHMSATTNVHGIASTAALETKTGAQAKADAAAGYAVQRANHTGTQSADTIVDGSSNKAFTAAEKTKLAAVGNGATVTDSTSVTAAGAVMKSMAATTGFAFVVDEDNMASNSDTKVPTQQSVKAYADGLLAGGVADATTSVKGKVQLAGDLAGTAAAPVVAAGAITNAKVAAGAAIDQTKIANLASDLAGKASAAALSAKTVRTVARVAGADHVCDGTDDHVEIQAAIDAVAGAGGGTVFIRGGTYSIGATLTVTSSNVAIVGEGQGITKLVGAATLTGNTPLIQAGASSFGTDRTLTATAAIGARTITVSTADAATFAVGDWVLLKSDKSIDSENVDKKAGQFNKVTAVDTGTGVLTLDDIVLEDYTTGDAAKVVKATVIERVLLANLSASTVAAESELSVGFLHFRYVNQLTVVNVEMHDAYHSLQLRSCFNTRIVNCTIRDIKDTKSAPESPSTPRNMRYGIWVGSASQNVVITGCQFGRTRHAVTTGGSSGTQSNGRQRAISVVGNTSYYSDTAHYDCHEGCDGVAFVGNTAIGGYNYQGAAGAVVGIQVRGQNVLVANNVINRIPGHGIMVFNADVDRVAIIGNMITDIRPQILSGGAPGTTNGHGINFDSAGSKEHLVVGNVIRNCYGRCISGSGGQNDTLIAGNSFYKPASPTGVCIYLTNTARVMVTGNQFYNDGGRPIQSAGTSDGWFIVGNSFQGAGVHAPALVGTANLVYNNMGLNPIGPYALGSVTGAVTVARSNGMWQSATLTGNVTLTVGGTNLFTGDELVLTLAQDGTGGRTVTWPSNVKLARGGLSPVSTSPNAVDVVSLVWDGTNWRETGRATTDVQLATNARIGVGGQLVLDNLGSVQAGAAGGVQVQAHADRLVVVDRDSYPSELVREWVTPADHGMLTWTFPPDLATGPTNTALTAGTGYVSKLFIPKRMTISNLHMIATNTAAGLTGVYGALYGPDGTLLAGSTSADQSTAWNATAGNRTIPLGAPQAVVAGWVYAVWWYLITPGTAPTLARAAGSQYIQNAFCNTTIASAQSLRYALTAAGLTTTAPASLTGNFNSANSIALWVGAS